MQQKMRTLVAGVGPAGWLAAVALAEQGADVTLVGDAPDAAWPARYGAWCHTLPDEVFDRRWPSVRVQLDDQRVHTLPVPYGRVSGEALQRSLRRRFAAAGGRVVADRVARILPLPDGARVSLLGRPAIDAALVVDATGAKGLSRPGATAFQTAWGVELEVPDHGLDADTMVLMDWRPAGAEDDDPRPSFLYAMPLGPDRVFVEETALVARPALPVDTLRDRLERRLAGTPLAAGRVVGVERCVIPMDIAPAARRPERVCFGVAAGFVHPASGYQLARSAALAPRLARAAVRAWQSGARGEALADAAHGAIWSAADKHVHNLFSFGADVLCELSAEQTRDFFDAFFSLPTERALGYLDRSVDPGQVMQAMWRVFGACSPELRRTLVARGWQDRGRVAGAVLGGLFSFGAPSGDEQNPSVANLVTGGVHAVHDRSPRAADPHLRR